MLFQLEPVGTVKDGLREQVRTSDQYAYGIRSTPTLIVNDRVILPAEQPRAIFRALIDEAEGDGRQAAPAFARLSGGAPTTGCGPVPTTF